MKTWMIAALLLLVSGCDDQGLPPDDSLKPAVTVQFLEASCTEAWLRLAPRNVSPPYTLTLLRNDSVVATFSSPPADTTVIDEGLAPSRTYTYRARLTSSSGLNLTGDPVQARTLDTTSHQFTWETTVLGDGGASVFYDVAIVNDTLAYAVGEVYLRDSSGVLEVLPYNFAVWNGSTWTLRRVTVLFRGQLITVPLEGVFAHSARDVWLVGGLAIHGDGVSWTPYDVRLITGYNGLSFTKCWGSSSRDMWFTGRVGSLAHFDGSSWRRVESGTSEGFNDAWGGTFEPLGGEVAAFPYGNKYDIGPTGFVVVKQTGGVEQIPWSPENTTRHSMWFTSRRAAYSAGALLYSFNGERWRYVAEVPSIYTNRVRGTGQNDVFAVGDFGLVVHFNGVTWRRYSEPSLSTGIYESVAISRGLVIAAGWVNSRAVLAAARRR